MAFNTGDEGTFHGVKSHHFFKHLAWQGHVIIDVAYSLAPAVDIFGMMGDVKRAIVWTKQHSDELKVHNDQVVVMGGSAGGHLALLAAYDLASPSSHASGSCPPTLLLQGGHDFGGAAPQVIELHKSLLKAGATSYLLELPDTEHGFDLYKPAWSPAAQAATYVTERFLASLL